MSTSVDKLLAELRKEESINVKICKDAEERKQQARQRDKDRRLARKLRLEERATEEELEQHKRRRAATQKRYHVKNRFRLNQERARRARNPEEVFKRAKRRAEERGQVWLLSYQDWFKIWQEAEDVVDPRTGFTKSAWSLKGGSWVDNTQMMRQDQDGPWSVSNCRIMFKESPL